MPDRRPLVSFLQGRTRAVFLRPVLWRIWGVLTGADAYTALAWAVARMAGATIIYRQGVYLAYGGRLPALLRHHPVGHVAAICMGRVILAPNSAALQRHLRHEWTHMRQFLRWGLLFPLLYVLEMAYQYALGRQPYHDNYYEKEARAAERSSAA